MPSVSLTMIVKNEEQNLETIHRARDVMDTPALACTEADLLIERGALPTARVCLASALSDEGDASPAWVRASTLLAEVLLALGEPATAEERAKLVVEKRPAYGAAWLALVDALLARGKLDAVTAIASRLEGARGAESASVITRAALLFHEGFDDGARDLTTEALIRFPNSDLLARFSARLGERDRRAPW